MPVVPITDLDIREGDLVASTQGRGFWILDDVSPIRQASEAGSPTAVHLFAPQRAFRLQGGGRRAGEAIRENPPNGAIIYYQLPERLAAPVKLEFLDAR